jgi:hypothetical protein
MIADLAIVDHGATGHARLAQPRLRRLGELRVARRERVDHGRQPRHHVGGEVA